jgi:hypothetical protein
VKEEWNGIKLELSNLSESYLVDKYTMLAGLSGDPVRNPKVPLDANILSAILGSYLRLDPENTAYITPDFRLKQMCDMIMPKGTQFDRNKIFHGSNMMKAQLVEHVGAIYVLCLYLLTTPNVNSKYIFRICKIVQAVQGDCLVMMNDDKKQQLLITHPYSLFDKPGETETILEVFRSANGTMKEILRDMIKQVRNSRVSQPQGSAKDKMDCWQPHSMYFMCGLGLCHYGCVAASIKNLATVPGTMESMVLAASLKPRPYSNASNTVTIFRDETTRFYLCFELLLPCARLAISKAFDGRTLTELRMFKRRLINASTNSSVEYARLKTLDIKAKFIGVPNPSLIEDEAYLENITTEACDYISVGCEDTIPIWFHERPAKGGSVDLNANIGLDHVGDDASVSSSRVVSRANTAAATNENPSGSITFDEPEQTPPPSLRSRLTSMYGADDDNWKPPAPEHEPGEEPWRKKKIFGRKPRSPQKLKSSLIKVDTSIKKPTEEEMREVGENDKEIKCFWEMNRFMRQIYISTRILRRNETVLPMLSPNYHPKRRYRKNRNGNFHFYTNPYGGVNSLEKLVACKDIESLFYEGIKKDICPKILNPGTGLFWLCNFMLEYIYQATFFGGGFNKDPQAITKRIHSDAIMSISLLETQGMRNGAGLIVPKIKKNTIVKSPIKGDTNGSKSRISLENISNNENLDIFQKLQLVSRQARSTNKVVEMQSKKSKEKIMIKNNNLPRLNKVDKTMQNGIKVMKHVATEQSDIYYDSDDQYSDTDDDDDYSDTESDESGESNEEYQNDTDVDNVSENSASIHGKRNTSHFEERYNEMSDPTDPFVQLTLMQADTTNALGQQMGEINTKDPLLYLMEQPELKSITKFRKKLKENGIIKSNKTNEITDDLLVSVVWKFEASVKDMNMEAKMGIGKLSKSEQAKQYVDSMKKSQKLREEEKLNNIKEMEDMQDLEVSKSRAHKMGIMHELRENRRLEKLENDHIIAKQIETKKKELRDKSTALRLANKRQLELEAVEKARIADIILWKEQQAEEEQMILDERFAMEAIRLKEMLDEKELQEILRRNREEARMKYLEEKRQFIENKDLYLAAASAAILAEKRTNWQKEIAPMRTYVRNGAFHAESRDGKVGFYQASRVEAVDYVQFEDDKGTSYYYDPVLKRTTYDVPNDAGIHHHTVDDRIAYDAIHGEGAYDAHVYNEMMIASVNENGGYFNHDGIWEEVNGFYDETGCFWDLNKGYFDKFGQWVLYPEVSGTLDFMV